MKKYRPHQEKMASYFRSTNQPALLVDMRLGKTLVTIRETIRKGINLIAVVAPINAMVPWKTQLKEEGEEYVEAYGMSSTKRAEQVLDALSRSSRVWVLINYEGFRFLPELLEVPWECVILDESVKIKSPKTQVSKAFTTAFDKVEYKAILTGNIAPESLLNVFQQFRFLNGRFMGYSNFWNWRMKFFEPAYDGYSWVPKKGNAKYITEIIHKKACVIRRKDVGMDKTKYYTTRSVGMSPKQRKMYEQVSKDFMYENSNGIMDDTLWATERAIWLSRIASGFSPDGSEVISTAKPEEILYLLQNELQKESVVIWYRFRATLIHDLQFFESAGISCAYLIGKSGRDGLPMSTAEAERQEMRFMQGKARVMLCMEKLGAYAKDFSIAATAIYRENEYSCDLRTQSEDRILNIGKLGGLSIIDLATEDTLDLAVIDTLKSKKFDSHLVMSNGLKKFSEFFK